MEFDFRTQSNLIERNRTQSNLIEKCRDHFINQAIGFVSEIEHDRTKSNPIVLNRTQSNSIELNQTQSNQIERSIDPIFCESSIAFDYRTQSNPIA